MSRVDAIDSKKTKQELLGELTTIRQRLAELETRVSRGDQVADAPNRLEGWFQTLFECAPDAYYLNTLEAQFVDGNRAAEALLGYQREEIIGKSFLEANLLSSDQLPKAAGLLMKSSQGQPTGPDEFVLTPKGWDAGGCRNSYCPG